jgi:hypothetical protein
LGRLPVDDDRSGSVFSVGYVVRDATSGRLAFCKAMDFGSAMAPDVENPEEELKRLADAYIFERDLVRLCGERRMSRVVRCLDDGRIRVPDLVSFLIFEKADADGRDVVDQIDLADCLTALRLGHDCAAALAQLHGGNIAHQDMKAANLLAWRSEDSTRFTGKLGDLGRAHCVTLPSPFDEQTVCVGDISWAAPERAYGPPTPPSPVERRASDLYGLGGLVAFLLTGVPYNGLLGKKLHDKHRWDVWTGSYEEALPYLLDAHGAVINTIREVLHHEIAVPISKVIDELCHPDVAMRGNPKWRGRPQQFDVHRYVTRFDLLRRRVEVERAGR